MSPRHALRPGAWGAALLLTVLIAGCSNGDNHASENSTIPSPSATPSSAPSAPVSPEAIPEPSPVISYLGKTKIVTLGDTEIRATRNELGINVACNATNTADRTRNIRVTVSIGNGDDWVTTNNFNFKQIPAGQTASESTVMGGSFEGDLPDDPEIHIDNVVYY
jgi:hypothetical protein